jgi:hypothetical protein
MEIISLPNVSGCPILGAHEQVAESGQVSWEGNVQGPIWMDAIYRQSLLESNTYTNGNRRYLENHFYNNVTYTAKHNKYPPYILTPNKNETTKVMISVLNQHGEVHSESCITVCKTSNVPFLDSIVKLGQDLNKAKSKGVRANGSDNGEMYGLGTHYVLGKEEEFAIHKEMESMERSVSASQFAKQECETNFLAVYQDITSKIKGGKPESMGGSGGVLQNAIVSVNLGNASHFDIRDISMSLAMWASNNEETVENWVLVFPNVVVFHGCNEHHGAVINLTHGTQVTWDGRLIRHCTAIPAVGDGTLALSYFVGASGPMAKLHLEQKL